MAEKGPNGQKLLAGEYEPGKKGGKGYWHMEMVMTPDGCRRREMWAWVVAPKGYHLSNGGIEKDGKNKVEEFCPGNFVTYSQRDD